MIDVDASGRLLLTVGDERVVRVFELPEDGKSAPRLLASTTMARRATAGRFTPVPAVAGAAASGTAAAASFRRCNAVHIHIF